MRMNFTYVILSVQLVLFVNVLFTKHRSNLVSSEAISLFVDKGSSANTDNNKTIRGHYKKEKAATSSQTKSPSWQPSTTETALSFAADQILLLTQGLVNTFDFFFFHGITFTRKVTQVAPGVNLTLTFHQGGEHCQGNDNYGNNDCKYHWGEDMGGLLMGSLPYDLVEGDAIHGDFLIDAVTPLTFSCNVCGQPCSIKIPVIDQEIQVDTPSCPINKDSVHHTIGKMLPDKVFVPETIIQGTIKAVKADGITVVLTAYANIKVHW